MKFFNTKNLIPCVNLIILKLQMLIIMYYVIYMYVCIWYKCNYSALCCTFDSYPLSAWFVCTTELIV